MAAKGGGGGEVLEICPVQQGAMFKKTGAREKKRKTIGWHWKKQQPQINIWHKNIFGGIPEQQQQYKQRHDLLSHHTDRD